MVVSPLSMVRTLISSSEAKYCLEFLILHHVLLKSTFPKCWKWEEGFERLERGPWRDWQQGAAEVDQVSLSVGLNTDACDSHLQSTVKGNFQSRTWEAAEFDEEEQPCHENQGITGTR